MRVRSRVCVRARGTLRGRRTAGGGARCLPRTGSLLSFGLRIGAVMARHRRPVSAPTPAELLRFSAAEWAARDDGPEDWRVYRRWQDARRAYSKAHPDSELGGVLDQLRFERQAQMGLTQ